MKPFGWSTAYRWWAAAAGLAILSVGMTPTLGEAAEMPALLLKNRCSACHDTNATLIGPPFLAVAIRYASDRDRMTEVLARKILLGGGGSWGVVPMIPNERVTLEEAREITQWILALKPTS